MEKKKINKKVIFGSGLGTIMEWYDFYLYGVLVIFFSSLFFPKGSEFTGVLVGLATFGAGFAVRPLGALFFGSIGDRWGRKSAFLITIVIMGLATAGIGVLPTYADIGIVAPIILVLLRMIQGFALGGEYAGALLYVAEHNPKSRLGLVTSFIQSTATIGLALALGIIMLTRSVLTEQDFYLWGWRLPFLFSIVLLSLSIYIRAGLRESPVFLNLKMRGQILASPLKTSFSGKNLKKMIILLFGLLAAQGVIWYTGHFYVWYYLQSILNFSMTQAFEIFIYPLLLAIPMFIMFGWLSDKIGAIKISCTAIVLAMLSYYAVFGVMVDSVNPNIANVLANKKISLIRGEQCLKECVQAQMFMNRNKINFNVETAKKNPETLTQNMSLKIAEKTYLLTSPDDKKFVPKIEESMSTAFISHGLVPQKEISQFTLQFLIWYLVVLVGMVYVPIASILIRSFPSNVSYTSISFVYHTANGWFGGFLPLISTYLLTQSQNIYAGLLYPVSVCAIGLIVTLIFIRREKIYEAKWLVEPNDMDKQTKYEE